MVIIHWNMRYTIFRQTQFYLPNSNLQNNGARRVSSFWPLEVASIVLSCKAFKNASLDRRARVHGAKNLNTSFKIRNNKNIIYIHIIYNLMFLVPGIWEARDCCHFLHYYENIIVWRGGGWGGGIITSFALPHICDATYLYALLHLIQIHTYVMLRFCKFFCTSTHTSCYAVGSLALLHMRHATL